MCVCVCARAQSCQKHRSQRSSALNGAGEKGKGGGSSHRGRMVSSKKEKRRRKGGMR